MTNPALAAARAAARAAADTAYDAAREARDAAYAAYDAAIDGVGAALATMTAMDALDAALDAAALDDAAKAKGGDAARLIAAAPEMLAALKLAEENMTASPAFNAWDVGPTPSLLAVRAAVRAAVRKAEGGDA